MFSKATKINLLFNLWLIILCLLSQISLASTAANVVYQETFRNTNEVKKGKIEAL